MKFVLRVISLLSLANSLSLGAGPLGSCCKPNAADQGANEGDVEELVDTQELSARESGEPSTETQQQQQFLAKEPVSTTEEIQEQGEKTDKEEDQTEKTVENQEDLDQSQEKGGSSPPKSSSGFCGCCRRKNLKAPLRTNSPAQEPSNEKEVKQEDV